MRRLRVYYARVENMGDRLNALIMDRVFGREIERHTPLTCELSGIGSGLGQFTYSEKPWLAAIECGTGKIWPETWIWGTGFIKHGMDKPFYRKKMHFSAVRGELSKKCVETILKKRIACPMGDGGILSDQLLARRPRPVYTCGIAAHYKGQGHPAFTEMAAQIQGSILIDVKADPLEVIRQIAQCECIVSSSLHALVIADSFGIPNIHLAVTNAMLGDGFKYDDYYSSFGVKHRCWRYFSGMRPDLDELYGNYEITRTMTDRQKQEMIRAFPF